MTDFTRMRRSAAQRAAALADADNRARDAASALAAARAELEAARVAGGRAAIRAARQRVDAAAAARERVVADRRAIHDRVAAGIERLLGRDVDLEADVPLVLLPVRIELRSTPDLASIRVRLFPDALHTQSLDEGLTDDEVTAGKAYWGTVWIDGDPQTPWGDLVRAVGERRAPWVAEALRPDNLADRPGSDPHFGEVSAAGAKPAVVRTLPDRFFVRIEQDGAAPATKAGRLIPDDLPVGLTSQSDLAVLSIEGEDLPPVDEGFRWLVDYAEAERLGMAVTIPLPVPGAPIRRLTAYGVRASLSAAQTAERLGDLVRSHHYTDGAEFVAQGTPTNNTESARTSWSKRTPVGQPSLDEPAALPQGANATVTASALGLDPALLGRLPGAADTEQPRARAFNTALWGTTWAEAIETISRPGRNNGDKRLDNPSLDALRDHWIDHVRGRGPLPALRFGRQPYGVLPIVDTGPSYKPLRNAFAERSVVPFLDGSLRPNWEDAVEAVATVLNRPLDEAMPEILGTDAVLRALRVRSALSPDPTFQTASAVILPDIGTGPARHQLRQTIELLAGIDPASLDDDLLVGKKTRSLALPMVHETDQAFVKNLLQEVPAPAAAKSVLQVLLAHAREVEADTRGRLVPPDFLGVVREAVASSRVEVDKELVIGAMSAVLEGQAFDDPIVSEAAKHVDEAVGRLDLGVVAARNPVPALAPVSLVQQVAGTEPRFGMLTGNLGMQLVGEVFHGARRAAEFRAALETIAAIESMEERRLLLSETLDCCSHRLDAWISSAAARRLQDLRDLGRTGVRLGAYGWLEDVSLHAPTADGQVDGVDVLRDGMNGGFVHAPGLVHAATAGVLRSGRLTHRRGDPNNEALDIDLSSARVRDALSLLDGMRRGQSLGALLGYRLERSLHEQSGGALELDRFIYVLRALAPLRAGKLTDPGQPVEEGLAASDVVDGLRITELAWSDVLAALQNGPKDNDYIPPGTWVAPRPGEAEAVEKAIAALQETHDAVADLLLAESVHQVVAGNPPRAAAVLDLLGAGEAPPPEPDVVRTPRSGTPLQHKIALVVADDAAPLPNWEPNAPRALAEPRLEVWAQHALGAVAVPAGACALDLLYDPDRFPGLDPVVAEVASLLRGLLAQAHPLDLGRQADGAELLARATAARDSLTTAAAEGTVEALAPFSLRPAPSDPDLPLTPEEEAVALEAMLEEATRRAAQATALVDQAAQAADRITDAQAAGQALVGGAVGPVARAQAERTAQELVDQATRAVRKSQAELAAQALVAVFGAGFLAVPLLPAPAAGDEWAQACGPGGVTARPGADIRPWLARAGTLREAASAYGETVLVREALVAGPQLRVVQTPAAAYPTWVGLPFPDSVPPFVPIQSTIAEVVGGDPAGTVAGVVVDGWTEVVPKRLQRAVDPAKPDDPPEVVDVTTTGVALNANAPGARPPQAILLAMSADGSNWNGDRLVRVLDEALALARMRCVTLEQVPLVGQYLPALYFRDWSLQGEPVIDWSKVAVEFSAAAITPFLAVKP
jgi:hypothetical protein